MGSLGNLMFSNRIPLGEFQPVCPQRIGVCRPQPRIGLACSEEDPLECRIITDSSQRFQRITATHLWSNGDYSSNRIGQRLYNSWSLYRRYSSIANFFLQTRERGREGPEQRSERFQWPQVKSSVPPSSIFDLQADNSAATSCLFARSPRKFAPLSQSRDEFWAGA